MPVFPGFPWVCCNLFDKYPIDGHLGHFQYFDIVNNTAVTNLEWTLLYICASVAIGRFLKVE